MLYWIIESIHSFPHLEIQAAGHKGKAMDIDELALSSEGHIQKLVLRQQFLHQLSQGTLVASPFEMIDSNYSIHPLDELQFCGQRGSLS